MTATWGRVPLAWRRRLAVALGGAIGTGLRVLVAAAIPPSEGAWPWATFLENVSGALLLGYLLTRLLAAGPPTALSLPLLCTGVLGSYTTFSTFAVEVARLGPAAPGVAAPGLAAAYALGSVAVGFAAAKAGIRLAEGRP